MRTTRHRPVPEEPSGAGREGNMVGVEATRRRRSGRSWSARGARSGVGEGFALLPPARWISAGQLHSNGNGCPPGWEGRSSFESCLPPPASGYLSSSILRLHAVGAESKRWLPEEMDRAAREITDPVALDGEALEQARRARSTRSLRSQRPGWCWMPIDAAQVRRGEACTDGDLRPAAGFVVVGASAEGPWMPSLPCGRRAGGGRRGCVLGSGACRALAETLAAIEADRRGAGVRRPVPLSCGPCGPGASGRPPHGELFAGYGGLGTAVARQVPRWTPCGTPRSTRTRLRCPRPSLADRPEPRRRDGDDWSTVPPVDVLARGLSLPGHLNLLAVGPVWKNSEVDSGSRCWDAVRVLRPRLVVVRTRQDLPCSRIRNRRLWPGRLRV